MNMVEVMDKWRDDFDHSEAGQQLLSKEIKLKKSIEQIDAQLADLNKRKRMMKRNASKLDDQRKSKQNDYIVERLAKQAGQQQQS